MNTQKTFINGTWLPLFPGFYCTIFQFEESDFLYENDLEFDDIEVDYATYETDVAKAYCRSFAEHMSDYVNDIAFQEVISPRYYNFRNDSVNIDVDYKALEVQRYCIENFDALDTYLKAHYTSYDGFMSHYPNSAEAWQELTNNFIDFSDGHTLGAILQFIALDQAEGYNIANSIACDVAESVYTDCYITIKETENN
jgi:hypothetical protein